MGLDPVRDHSRPSRGRLLARASQPADVHDARRAAFADRQGAGASGDMRAQIPEVLESVGLLQYATTG